MLDMGSPVKIVDLARQLIQLSGLRPDKDIRIEYVGLQLDSCAHLGLGALQHRGGYAARGESGRGEAVLDSQWHSWNR